MLARQGLSESDVSISIMYVMRYAFLCLMSMLGCRVKGWCVVLRQGPSESDVSISMKCVFLCVMNRLTTKPQRAPE